MKIDDQNRIKYIRGELKGKDLKDFQSILSKNPREKEKIENLKTTHLAIDELFGSKNIKDLIPRDSEENFKKLLKGHDSYITNSTGEKKTTSNNFLFFFTNIKQNFTKAAAPALVTAGIIGALISPTYQIATRGGLSDNISVALLDSQEDRIQTRGAYEKDDFEQNIKKALSKLLGKDLIDEKLEDIEDKINTAQQSLDDNSSTDIVLDNTTTKITAKSSFVSKSGDNCRLLELHNTKEKKKLSFVACNKKIIDWNFYYFFK